MKRGSPAAHRESKAQRGRLYNGSEQGQPRTLGAPRPHAQLGQYQTKGGILVHCVEAGVEDPLSAIEELVDRLDEHRGCLFQSSYDFPGRYARWTMGFSDPPLVMEACGRSFTVSALNSRGRVLLPAISKALHKSEALQSLETSDADRLVGTVKPPVTGFAEEERSRQHSIFSIVRALQALFYFEDEPQLGLYGAFGYDLTYQFEPVTLHQQRDPAQRDLVLYLPDEILVVDVLSNAAWKLQYDFTVNGESTLCSTAGLAREGATQPYMPRPETEIPRRRDHEPGAFARKVSRAKEEFKVGNLFETVLSQTFFEPCPQPPSTVFRRLRHRNPSPYGFLLNLGRAEYLVGASPEMFVRVERNPKGWRCETCPISGTIKRGANAIEDAEAIKKILSDAKEESELTMCTDVDRNDKSRICQAGSVQVIGRRQIEMYSRLIHTVDHVEGYLREGFDAMDAFLCHTWAVTVTGAPKTWAIQFVEEQEESARCWYGGAVGMLGFDGTLNTGLTLRTVRIAQGVAEVRAGATLLFDSTPEDEERETELKASAMRDAILRPDPSELAAAGPADGRSSALSPSPRPSPADAPRVLLVDHQDSFVHTLANYLRQTGAHVTTMRCGFDAAILDQLRPNLVVLSPGPGSPKDFGLSTTIAMANERRLPIFGVCLGLQGLVEHYGGELGVLPYPQHGKPATVTVHEPRGELLHALPESFQVGRYHSLFSKRSHHPSELRITAATADGCVMAIEHVELPIAAVQFHPESILTPHELGLSMLSNAINRLRYPS